ncbi:hypothetical protein [Bradymonas sediminis]|uniref:Uncharacterized protein n=1 Tax=Bradymonas sediminis TaxID=1548548 RepID=A0A2Z4FQD3_9DELT|nr:hypothetical protein [Bradymonas sediminis]AWV91102.1 hypothetical protein DN745_17900 [Bradymonas sediminis]TDP75154.1 hypothetical protein DFR33_10418 [Bradymonas sediminis]
MSEPEKTPPDSLYGREYLIRRGFLAVVGVLCGLGYVLFWDTADTPSSSDSSSEFRASHDDSPQAGQDAEPLDAGVAYVWKRRGDSKGLGAPVEEASPRRVVMRPDIIEASAPDTGASVGADASEWVDPVNQRVLGRKAWMAEVPEDEEAAIEAMLDAPAPARYPIDLGVREWSVDIAAEVVRTCFGEDEPSGRFALNYTLAADGSRATFEDVRLSHIYKMETPSLGDCVADTLSQRSFRSTEDGQMRVSRPFFFDGTQAPK